MWNIFKVNNENPRMTSATGTYFTHFSTVFIADFEQVNVS